MHQRVVTQRPAVGASSVEGFNAQRSAVALPRERERRAGEQVLVRQDAPYGSTLSGCHGRLVRAEAGRDSAVGKDRLVGVNFRPMGAAFPGKMPGADSVA